MDKYQVLDLIGEGSFGRVFRGRDKETGDVVALKLIPKLGHSEREMRSLRSECKIQRALRHPNIVQMIDAFETENEVISVAEFVPGELFRLFDQFKAEVGYRRLPEPRVAEIAGDLVSALHYLHSHRILHRDIKPQNILLDQGGRAKLCDFGFARNLGINTFVLTSIKGIIMLQKYFLPLFLLFLIAAAVLPLFPLPFLHHYIKPLYFQAPRSTWRPS